MPRIRTIKPEFWTAGQILECSRDARLLFIGLWNFCDDEGRHPLRLRQIKAEVFPADQDIDTEGIRRMLDELSANDLTRIYRCPEGEFIEVTGWKRHQKIDRPQPAKYPSPNQPVSGDSTNARRTLALDRKGKEGKGEDRRKEDISADGAEKGPHPFPDDFTLTEDLEAYADRYGLTRDEAEGVFEDLRNWALSKGKRQKSWPMTYQTFVRTESKRKAKGNGKARAVDILDHLESQARQSVSTFGDY